MPEETPQKPAVLSSQPPDREGFYKTPAEASQRVGNEFDYWSGKLTDSSLQMCYALIGANWVIFGSVGNILKSGCAKWSLLMVLLTLGANVVGSWWASEEHRSIFEFAEGHDKEWKEQFEDAKGKRTAWPFTKRMEQVGFWLRQIKGSFPLISGVLLLIGAIIK